MKTNRLSTLHPLAPAALLLLGVSAFAPVASAQTVTAPTVITSVPYSISTGGKYVLGQGLTNTSTSTPAIYIGVSNVYLDLGGFNLSGAGNVASSNEVIEVGDVSNVTITNGTVANEGIGIVFVGYTDPRNYLVDGVTFTHCYSTGVEFAHPVIGGVVRYCKFSDLGSASNNTDGYAYGILTDGGVRIEKNTIDTLVNGPGVNSFGIYSDDGNADFAIGNTIANCVYGVVYCTFLNNLTTKVTYPLSPGTAATGNTSTNNNNN